MWYRKRLNKVDLKLTETSCMILAYKFLTFVSYYAIKFLKYHFNKSLAAILLRKVV